MASTITRRPLPALISLVALLLLTALVWWRVMNRDTGDSAEAKTCPTPTATATTAAPKQLPPQSSVDVFVRNATTRSGIAAKARTALLADGFKATLRANNDDSSAKVTGPAQIRYSADKKAGALLLQYYFPGAVLTQVSTPSPQVTVALGPTYTAVQPQKTVAARLAADKVMLTTAAPTPAASSPSTTSC